MEEISDDDFDLLPDTIVPNKILGEIGAVAVYFTLLDHILNRCIWALLDLGATQGTIVTGSILNFSSRVDLFLSLCQQKYGDVQKERIKLLRQQLTCAGGDRNRLMHDEVLGSEENPDYPEFIAISTHRVNPVTRAANTHRFDRDTMQDLQERLRRLFDILGRGRDGWLNAPLPSLDKSPTLLLQQENSQKQKQDKPQSPPESSRG